jgi:hypothetical protein
MRAPEDAVPLPELRVAARLRRSLLAASVVFASAGVGFAGSRIWPLPTFSGPVMHFAVTGNTGSGEPQPSVSIPPLDPLVSKSSAATDRSASLDAASQPDPVIAELPMPQVETEDPTTRTHIRKGATRRLAASARAYRTVRRQNPSTAAAKIVEFAPNPRPDQALRDFMGRSTRN